MTFGELLGIEGYWGEVRFEDFLDIAIVSIALSVLLGWLKRRSTRPLLFTALVVFGVYGLARWRNLYLTLEVFQVGFLILIAATLLAYQEDLRRGFERLVTGNLFTRRRPAENAEIESVMTVTEAVYDLAERRFGALIVIPGDESLDRLLQGGVEVGARPSVPLVLSIFDPHTPAHDGAMVLDNEGLIDRLAVHLPLSSNIGKLGGRGTRHAAALGLTELSDALVIVVSEERGSINIAEAGEFKTIESPEKLSGILKKFYQGRGPTPSGRRMARMANMDVKVLSVVLASLLWFAFAAPSEPVQQSYDVRVELIDPPENWRISSGPIPSSVTVMLSGPEHAFRQLDERTLRLTMDLTGVRPGTNRLPTAEAQLNLPEALRHVRTDTETIYVEMAPPNQPPNP